MTRRNRTSTERTATSKWTKDLVGFEMVWSLKTLCDVSVTGCYHLFIDCPHLFFIQSSRFFEHFLKSYTSRYSRLLHTNWMRKLNLSKYISRVKKLFGILSITFISPCRAHAWAVSIGIILWEGGGWFAAVSSTHLQITYMLRSRILLLTSIVHSAWRKSLAGCFVIVI